jgi:branched-chain amino acid transport system substrate-binding protein
MTRLVLVCMLAVVPAASGATSATPGVSATEIVVGSSGPLTDGVLRGADAYFKYVNARGGVNGRKIVFKYVDDGGDPLRTLENVRELVEVDHVLALFSVGGAEGNAEIRELTTAAKVPVVFSATGATALGNARRYPYSIGYLPPYAGEGRIYARHVLASSPARARIGVFYETGAHGKGLRDGLRKGLGTHRGLIVGEAAYDPLVSDVGAAVAGLKARGADTLMIFAAPDVAVEALAVASRLRWRPQVYVSQDAAASAAMRSVPLQIAQGAISIAFRKEPATRRWASDPGVQLAVRLAKKYAPAARPSDGSVVTGMAAAYSFVDALSRAGKRLTRETLWKAATTMNEASNPFLLPGISVRTTATDRFPISQVGLQRWDRGRWAVFGGLYDAKP